MSICWLTESLPQKLSATSAELQSITAKQANNKNEQRDQQTLNTVTTVQHLKCPAAD